VFRYANCHLPAVSLIAAETIALGSLRTHTFDLDHAEDAIRTTIEQKATAMKVMVRV